MSHSIHILSIQIDTKSLKLVIYHQFNNIKLSFFTSHVKSSFHYVRLMDAVRLLDTLEYFIVQPHLKTQVSNMWEFSALNVYFESPLKKGFEKCLPH